MNAKIPAALIALAALLSCSGKSSQSASSSHEGVQSAEEPAFARASAFCADSAMAFAAAQTAMGPRTPGSEAHARCTDWIVSTMKRFGADSVVVQRGAMKGWDGKSVPVANVFASYNAPAQKRILLVAHYDTRPWADRDPDESARHTPIDGANDGASGVAVMLEMARCMASTRPDVGVDFLFADAEDSGTPDFASVGSGGDEDTWCLGTQYFVENLPYATGSLPIFGILFDMVGGRDARFNTEYFSARYASRPTAIVWDTARRLGLGDRFPQEVGGAITDDHLPLIRAGIPTVDIIESQNPETGSFAPTWHTLDDNIDNLDVAPMADAGRVALAVIYSQK